MSLCHSMARPASSIGTVEPMVLVESEARRDVGHAMTHLGALGPDRQELRRWRQPGVSTHTHLVVAPTATTWCVRRLTLEVSMARIAAPDLPGITALFAFRPETAAPLGALAEALLRGPSPLSSADRETIAAVVSRGNDCEFCARSHSAAAAAHAGGNLDRVRAACSDIDTAPISDKLKALLHVALQVRHSGKAVRDETVAAARAVGVTDVELHDTVLIAAAFSMFNRYVDGLQTSCSLNDADYTEMGRMMAQEGYLEGKDAAGA
jgi:uncharacterized peroxidase-related enzyme